MTEEERAARRAAIEEIKKNRQPSAIRETRSRRSHAMPLGLCPTPFCKTVTMRGPTGVSVLCFMCASKSITAEPAEKDASVESYLSVEQRPTSPVAWAALGLMVVLTIAAAYMQKHEDQRSVSTLVAD
jgi:hypothetical protein